MTAAELIVILQGVPADAPVVVEGYETGWDAVHAVEVCHVERYRHAQPWDGEYRNGRSPAVAIIGRREQRRQP